MSKLSAEYLVEDYSVGEKAIAQIELLRSTSG